MSDSSPEYIIDGRQTGPGETTGGNQPAVTVTDGPSGQPEEIDPPPTELLRILFDLGSRDVATFRALLETPGQTSREVAADFDIDRSNANRALLTLVETGLATRWRRIPTTGGQEYHYAIRPRDELDSLIRPLLEEWKTAAGDTFEEFVRAGSDARSD
jgi:predicted transcriptional regulator